MYSYISSVNNGVLYSTHGMPQKDSTSDGTSSFAIGRHDYIKTNNTTTTTKKWYGNRDASTISSKRKNMAIGKGSYNTTGLPISFQTKNNINVRQDALKRVRNSGYVTTPKIRSNTHNSLTPSWTIQPLIRTMAHAPVAL